MVLDDNLNAQIYTDTTLQAHVLPVVCQHNAIFSAGQRQIFCVRICTDIFTRKRRGRS